VVFKLCAAELCGAVRNSKGATIFCRQYEIFEFFYRNLADFSFKRCMLFTIKKFAHLLEVPRAKKFENHWVGMMNQKRKSMDTHLDFMI
jgi:hypothetical protein